MVSTKFPKQHGEHGMMGETHSTYVYIVFYLKHNFLSVVHHKFTFLICPIIFIHSILLMNTSTIGPSRTSLSLCSTRSCNPIFWRSLEEENKTVLILFYLLQWYCDNDSLWKYNTVTWIIDKKFIVNSNLSLYKIKHGCNVLKLMLKVCLLFIIYF